MRACLDKQLSQTCKDYSNNQRLKGEIERAVTAVLRGRRFFCEVVNLRNIDLDIKVRPLVPCSREFFPEMEKCAKPFRNEYAAGNRTADELCRYGLFYHISNSCISPSVPVDEGSTLYNFGRSIGLLALTTKLHVLTAITNHSFFRKPS